MDIEVDLDGQHPFVEFGGGSIKGQGFWYEDNFAGVGGCGCGWDGSHDGVVGSSTGGGVTERIVVNNDSELSGDPLLVQLVRGPTLVNLVGSYPSELFQEPGISERDKWGVETMRGPLFSMMDRFGTATVLSDREVVEMMRLITKIQR